MTENLKQFIYDETKTAEEMAAASGLTVKQVQNKLQRLGYSHRQNKEKKNFEKVKEFFEKNPTATPSQAAKATKLSRPSIYKFRAMGDTYVSTGTSIQSTPVCLSVADNLNKTLRGIISLHLKTKTFECDLTFGEGGFYKKGIPIPTNIYDIFDYGENNTIGIKVERLDLENQANIKVNSVVIDLPVTIGENSFGSSLELYDTYKAYIRYVDSILNKGGVLVFSTADFILRDEEDNAWATDYAISVASSLGFSLKDKIHLVRKGDKITVDGVTVKSGLKDSAFLIFTKN